MYFYLTGIDYNSAPIEARERLYRNRKDISEFCLRSQGAVVLVTCNRIEIYGVTEYPDDAFSAVSGFFKTFPDFAKYAYTIYGAKKVFSHALRLAAGLKSQVKGELQILAQLESWISAADFPAPLKILWDEAILLSRDLRRLAGFYDENNNIASFIFEDIRKNVQRKESCEILVIGTGKIAELFARFRPYNARLNFVAHRNFQKAEALAARSAGKAWLLKDMPSILGKVDAVISATNSPHHVLKKKHFEGCLAERNQGLFIYDLSMPRGVEPEVISVPGVSLYNIDELQTLLKQGYVWLKISR